MMKGLLDYLTSTEPDAKVWKDYYVATISHIFHIDEALKSIGRIDVIKVSAIVIGTFCNKLR